LKDKFGAPDSPFSWLCQVFEQLKTASEGREGFQRDLNRDMAKTLNNLAAVLHQVSACICR
jgi:hypothetical protein